MVTKTCFFSLQLRDDLFIHVPPVQKEANFFITPTLTMEKQMKMINWTTEKKIPRRGARFEMVEWIHVTNNHFLMRKL